MKNGNVENALTTNLNTLSKIADGVVFVKPDGSIVKRLEERHVTDKAMYQGCIEAIQAKGFFVDTDTERVYVNVDYFETEVIYNDFGEGVKEKKVLVNSLQRREIEQNHAILRDTILAMKSEGMPPSPELMNKYSNSFERRARLDSTKRIVLMFKPIPEQKEASKAEAEY